MSLADTIERVRSGVLQITFIGAQDEKIGGGSGFICQGHLITNHHVFLGAHKATKVMVQYEEQQGNGLLFSAQEFAKRVITGSEEDSYDYAILRIPEIIRKQHQFSLKPPTELRIGDPIAILGYPLDHYNFTCHHGVISSFFTSKLTNFIQLDGSVNAGNSGGPLIDMSGDAIGIVTRKATGLTAAFKMLGETIRTNIQMLNQQMDSGVFMSIGGVDPVKAIWLGQNQMLATLGEIERQANVGIGYAISADHLLAEPCLQ